MVKHLRWLLLNNFFSFCMFVHTKIIFLLGEEKFALQKTFSEENYDVGIFNKVLSFNTYMYLSMCDDHEISKTKYKGEAWREVWKSWANIPFCGIVNFLLLFDSSSHIMAVAPFLFLCTFLSFAFLVLFVLVEFLWSGLDDDALFHFFQFFCSAFCIKSGKIWLPYYNSSDQSITYAYRTKMRHLKV